MRILPGISNAGPRPRAAAPGQRTPHDASVAQQQSASPVRKRTRVRSPPEASARSRATRKRGVAQLSQSAALGTQRPQVRILPLRSSSWGRSSAGERCSRTAEDAGANPAGSIHASRTTSSRPRLRSSTAEQPALNRRGGGANPSGAIALSAGSLGVDRVSLVPVPACPCRTSRRIPQTFRRGGVHPPGRSVGERAVAAR